jgi:hypothetical protein
MFRSGAVLRPGNVTCEACNTWFITLIRATSGTAEEIKDEDPRGGT